MEVTISPSNIHGTLNAPASKSVLQRALAAACLSNGAVRIGGYSASADANAVISVIRALGSDVEISGTDLFVSPGKKEATSSLCIGESGLGIRLFSPILALQNKSFVLNAEGSLLKRPLHLIASVLQGNGANCKTQNGFAPLQIQGPLQGGNIQFDASEGSQLLSGLLMALPTLKVDSVLEVSNLKSKPYVDLTLDVLNYFGVAIENQYYKRFKISGNQKYDTEFYKVEGDWSGAAFLLVAGVLSGNVVVENIQEASFQGDKNICQVLNQCGAQLIQELDKVHVKKGKLLAFEYDATETPDLFPPLAALATACSGVSRIKGVHRLTYKESNRAEAIATLFKQLGLRMEIQDDEMLIWGESRSKGGKVSSFNDHRMAMMAAVLGLNAENEIIITEAESCQKSYPHFFSDLEQLGAKLKIAD